MFNYLKFIYCFFISLLYRFLYLFLEPQLHKNHKQSGQLTVIEKGKVDIVLGHHFHHSNKIKVKFKHHHHPHPCNPKHHDHLDWKYHTFHNFHILTIYWDVEESQVIEWCVN